MKNDRLALAESLVLHGLLVGAIFLMVSMLTPPPPIVRLDFSLEQVEAPAPKEQAVQEMPQIPQPVPLPKPQPKIIAHIPPRKVKKITTIPKAAAVEPRPQNAPQMEKKTQPTAAPVQEQHIAANGSSTPQKTSSTTHQDRSLLLSYLSLIRTRIEDRKQYPLWARSHGIEGEVSVRFVLDPNGQVSMVSVSRSSGRESLDQAAVEAVQEAAPMPHPPNGVLTRPTSMELTIVFTLT